MLMSYSQNHLDKLDDNQFGQIEEENNSSNDISAISGTSVKSDELKM